MTLTGGVEELREGLHRYELLLEGLQGLVSGLVDGHVIVADVLGEGAGPASLRVAGRHLLQAAAGDRPGSQRGPSPGRKDARPPVSPTFPLEDAFCFQEQHHF